MYGKISAIVPVYNTAEQYLTECVHSVINQSYSNFELILVDDGSKNETASLCDKLSEMDSRIKVIHQKNAGPSIARNTGLKIVTGDYFTFIDSDDSLDKYTWEESLRKMEECNSDCFFFGWIDNSGGEPKKRYVAEGSDVVLRADISSVMIASDNEACGGGYPWNKIWRTSSVKENNGGIIPLFDTELFAYEDKEWILRTLQGLNTILLSTDVFYNYRFVENSLTNNADSWYRRQYNAYLAYDKILELLKDNNYEAYCGALNFYFYFGFTDLYNQIKHPSWFGGISRVRKTKKCMYALCKKAKLKDLKGYKRKLLWFVMQFWGRF